MSNNTFSQSDKPLILVTNDDGIRAKGIKALVEMVKDFGEIVVVAPNKSNSGKSNSITVDVPIRIKKILQEENITKYSCTGTPVDCVKLALNKILDRKPDFLVSGVNHGTNSSISVMYSGTMGATIEGCINGIPSIGFSLDSFESNPDFSESIRIGKIIFSKVLKQSLSPNMCLNVNFPKGNIKGIKVCRQTHGVWKEEFDQRSDPFGRDYYWLTGHFINCEPNNEGTDEWALKNNYASIVPTHIDMTAYRFIDEINNWFKTERTTDAQNIE